MHIITFLLYLFTAVDSFKILVYNPKFGFSHVNFMGRIADTLAEAGHQVTVLQPLMLTDISYNGSTKAKLIHLDGEKGVQRDHAKAAKKFFQSMWTQSATNPFESLTPIPLTTMLFPSNLEQNLGNIEVCNYLSDQKFDIGIAELIDMSAFVLFHRFGIKNIVGAHSMVIMEQTSHSLGLPTLPSFVPSTFGVTSDDGSFYSRAVNAYTSYSLLNLMHRHTAEIQSISDKHLGSNSPKLLDMLANVTWILTNSEPLFDFPAPTLSNIVQLGNIIVRETKKLDKYWDEILSRREQTVLFSFGSIVRSSLMNIEYKNNLVNTFARFPNVTFIWKYEEDMPNVNNIIYAKWTPQHDLLADPRLSAFITHGGAGSMREAAIYGKPLLVIPVFADQIRNAHMIERTGMGTFFNKKDLSNPEVIYSAIYQLLNEDKFRIMAQKMANMLKNTSPSYKEKLLHTIDLAGKFGHLPNLKLRGATMSVIEYYNIDVILLLVIFSLSIPLLIAMFITVGVRRLFEVIPSRTITNRIGEESVPLDEFVNSLVTDSSLVTNSMSK